MNNVEWFSNFTVLCHLSWLQNHWTWTRTCGGMVWLLLLTTNTIIINYYHNVDVSLHVKVFWCCMWMDNSKSIKTLVAINTNSVLTLSKEHQIARIRSIAKQRILRFFSEEFFLRFFLSLTCTHFLPFKGSARAIYTFTTSSKLNSKTCK